MNKFSLHIIFLLMLSGVFAQDISGTWHGVLKVPSQDLPIVFHISNLEGVYVTTMDSPAQGAKGLPTDKTIFENKVLEITMSKLMIVFKGSLKNNIIDGTFTQADMAFPLKLTKGEYKFKSKPQEPTKPYPYLSEEVTFKNSNAGNIKLSGTLTIPKNVKNPPVVVLISGSGAQNRNEEILGHQPFLVLADHLTKKGIAVLRYDDRGFADSEGDFTKATTYDFASDVIAAVTYLKSRGDVVDINKIGLIGHSEGGMIAPFIASESKNISFIVLLAGPGITGDKILLSQSRKALELAGVPENEIEISEKYFGLIYKTIARYKGEESDKEINRLLHEMKNASSGILKAQLTEDGIAKQIKFLTSPWMQEFIKFDPDSYLSKVKCPVLAINGEKDTQVLAEINLLGIEKGLNKSENKDVTIRKLKDLNHLFQTSKTGSFNEYAKNEETFSPIALDIISDWILKRF